MNCSGPSWPGYSRRCGRPAPRPCAGTSRSPTSTCAGSSMTWPAAAALPVPGVAAPPDSTASGLSPNGLPTTGRELQSTPTRCPTCRPLAFEPTAVTRPTSSWPRIAGYCEKPQSCSRRRDRSDTNRSARPRLPRPRPRAARGQRFRAPSAGSPPWQSMPSRPHSGTWAGLDGGCLVAALSLSGHWYPFQPVRVQCGRSMLLL